MSPLYLPSSCIGGVWSTEIFQTSHVCRYPVVSTLWTVRNGFTTSLFLGKIFGPPYTTINIPTKLYPIPHVFINHHTHIFSTGCTFVLSTISQTQTQSIWEMYVKKHSQSGTFYNYLCYSIYKYIYIYTKIVSHKR